MNDASFLSACSHRKDSSAFSHCFAKYPRGSKWIPSWCCASMASLRFLLGRVNLYSCLLKYANNIPLIVSVNVNGRRNVIPFLTNAARADVRDRTSAGFRQWKRWSNVSSVCVHAGHCWRPVTCPHFCYSPATYFSCRHSTMAPSSHSIHLHLHRSPSLVIAQ